MAEDVLFREDLFKKTADGYVLVGSKCTQCGKIYYPKTDFCVECLNEEFEEVELSKRGTLFTYTITRMPVGKFTAPHPFGIIVLPEKVRLTAPLVMSEDEKFEIGSEMEMVICPYWTEEDKTIIGYKFKAVQ